VTPTPTVEPAEAAPARREPVRTAAAQTAAAEPPQPAASSAPAQPRQAPQPSPGSERPSEQAKPAPVSPPRSEAGPTRQVARTPASSQSGQSAPKRSAQSAAAAATFPEVSVSRVRWHPDPERRVAWIELEQAGPLEAREGDIVAGVMVRRIDPGAVEVQVGASKLLIPLEP
jgi:hypothetical protein